MKLLFAQPPQTFPLPPTPLPQPLPSILFSVTPAYELHNSQDVS